jgi:hypothetical protein
LCGDGVNAFLGKCLQECGKNCIKPHNAYSSPSIIRIIKLQRTKWYGNVGQMGESRDVYSLLVEKSEGESQLRRPRCRRVDNSKMELGERGWDGGMDWSGSGTSGEFL